MQTAGYPSRLTTRPSSISLTRTATAAVAQRRPVRHASDSGLPTVRRPTVDFFYAAPRFSFTWLGCMHGSPPHAALGLRNRRHARNNRTLTGKHTDKSATAWTNTRTRATGSMISDGNSDDGQDRQRLSRTSLETELHNAIRSSTLAARALEASPRDEGFLGTDANVLDIGGTERDFWAGLPALDPMDMHILKAAKDIL